MLDLAEAILEIIDILKGRPASGGDDLDNWKRIVGVIAKHESFSQKEVEVVEKAIAEACRGWSNAQRWLIWHETNSDMADADDDSLADKSLSGIDYFPWMELLDEVTCAAWQDARALKRAWANRSPRRKRAVS